MDRLNVVLRHIGGILKQKDRVLVAIDGKCTSGKTTLAAQLKSACDCNVFHMDEFFLRPEQRTPERYAEAGGNVDYERFLKEVLQPLLGGKPFSYRPFDCKTFTLTEPVPVSPKRISIIEGSYSMHPYFGTPYDLKILLTVSPEVQRQRIQERPAFLHERFFSQWIPMENQYFEEFKIAEQADVIL